jgi:hypothetical protein
MPTTEQIKKELIRVTTLSVDVIGIISTYYPEIPHVEEQIVHTWIHHPDNLNQKLYDAMDHAATTDYSASVFIQSCWNPIIQEIVSEYGYSYCIHQGLVHMGLPHHIRYPVDPVPTSWVSRRIIQSFSEDPPCEERDDKEPSPKKHKSNGGTPMNPMRNALKMEQAAESVRKTVWKEIAGHFRTRCRNNLQTKDKPFYFSCHPNYQDTLHHVLSYLGHVCEFDGDQFLVGSPHHELKQTNPSGEFPEEATWVIKSHPHEFLPADQVDIRELAIEIIHRAIRIFSMRKGVFYTSKLGKKMAMAVAQVGYEYGYKVSIDLRDDVALGVLDIPLERGRQWSDPDPLWRRLPHVTKSSSSQEKPPQQQP